MKKMNNKGFSLVELIVVVLIMAIIAVALAPQVMKWVENSRKSTDCNNYDSVVSAVSIALANETVMQEIGSNSVTLTWDKAAGGSADGTTAQGDTWAVTSSGTTTSLVGSMGSILGQNWQSDIKVKRTKDFAGVTLNGSASSCWTITILADGTVERTCAPSSKDIS